MKKNVIPIQFTIKNSDKKDFVRFRYLTSLSFGIFLNHLTAYILKKGD